MADLKLVYSATKGEFAAALKEKYHPIAVASTKAVTAAATGAKVEARADASRVLGTRFANALRMNLYPGDGRNSVDAAAYFFHRIPYAEIFEDGGTIRGQPWLWLPLPTAPKRIGRQRITPALYQQRIGKLRFVKRPGKPPLLVADLKVGKRSLTPGKTVASLAKQSRKGAKGVTKSVPMFFGLSAVDIHKRTHLRDICAAAQAKVPGLYVEFLDPDI